jgi:hypothetical protein
VVFSVRSSGGLARLGHQRGMDAIPVMSVEWAQDVADLIR